MGDDSGRILSPVLKTDQRLIDFVTGWLIAANPPEKTTHKEPPC